ncbi:hypothetical protein LXL04_019537 [Taraxacum kok-saghyz]
MLLSIHVEAEFAEERTVDHGTASSQLRRSDRGGFPYDMILYPVGIVWLCVDSYHLTLLASVALSVSVGVYLHGLSLSYEAASCLPPISPLSCRYVFWKGKDEGVIIHTVATPDFICLCFRTFEQWILINKCCPPQLVHVSNVN